MPCFNYHMTADGRYTVWKVIFLGSISKSPRPPRQSDSTLLVGPAIVVRVSVNAQLRDSKWKICWDLLVFHSVSRGNMGCWFFMARKTSGNMGNSSNNHGFSRWIFHPGKIIWVNGDGEFKQQSWDRSWIMEQILPILPSGHQMWQYKIPQKMDLDGGL